MTPEIVYSAIPILAIVISSGAAILIGLFGNRVRYLNEGVSLGAAVIKFALVYSMYTSVMAGTIYICNPVALLPGVDFSFRVDPIGVYFAFLSSLLWIVTTIYSIGYMEALNEHARTRYFLSFAVCVASTIGIAFSGNLLTFFIFYEILTFATYPLVVHTQTKEALDAGRKYLAYLMSGGIVLLFAIITTYIMTGTLDFADGGILAGSAPVDTLRILFILFMIGVGVKTAIMPLHAWLPAAMVAPTPVSALLHAVAVVKAGAFGVLRVLFYVFGFDLTQEIGMGPFLAAMAAITIIIASIIALAQDNLKMRLAYSTVSQLSYIVLGAALLTPAGLLGGIAHMMHQAFMKITLFFCAGAIFALTGKKLISEMHGTAEDMPYTWAAFTIGGLGMIGIPLTCGFVTKWYLLVGSLQADAWVYIAVLLTSALLNAAYFLPPVYHAYFSPKTVARTHEHIQTTRPWIRLCLVGPPVCTAAAVIIFGIAPLAPYFPLDAARLIVAWIMGV